MAPDRCSDGHIALNDHTYTLPAFDTPQLAQAIEALPPEIVHRLPFGVIRLDADNNVAFYSETERRLSCYDQPVINRQFFASVAPCTDDHAFRGRIDSALAAGRLDISFDHIGDFNDPTREIRVRVQSASGGGCWIFMQRE